MNKNEISEKLLKSLNESLIIAKTSIAYCIDEAQPSEEVDVLKFAFEEIVKNLSDMKKFV